MFKVTMRSDCEICHKPLPKRFRRFCSEACRQKYFNAKYYPSSKLWQQKKRGEYRDDKIQCPDCGQWYVQLGTHVIQAHGYETAREFRETYDLEVKRGTVPEWYRALKASQVFENGTVKNLKAGERYRFKPKDPRAGQYHRSHITMERLRKLSSTRKEVKKDEKKMRNLSQNN